MSTGTPMRSFNKNYNTKNVNMGVSDIEHTKTNGDFWLKN